MSMLVIGGIVLGFIYYQTSKLNSNKIVYQTNKIQTNLKSYTPEELANFNGIDPKMPIYLALDGNVYDVSKGKEFYKLGGAYHDLAGKDSSTELHLVGGDIIKRKYPIIGKLSVNNK